MATILVVDDQAPIRALLRAALEGDGHDVLEAANGRLALEVYRERPADLVITDIVMPEMNGLLLMVELTRRCPQVKVIAISGGQPHDAGLQAASAFGARQTFHKPFDIKELLTAVREELAQ